MKTKLLIFTLLLISVSIFAQQEPDVQFVKQNSPRMYASIRTCSINKWQDDYEMIKYEIKKQCEATLKMADYIINKDKDSIEYNIIVNAMIKWSDGDCTDYEMVVYEYEKQIKAYNDL